MRALWTAAFCEGGCGVRVVPSWLVEFAAVRYWPDGRLGTLHKPWADGQSDYLGRPLGPWSVIFLDRSSLEFTTEEAIDYLEPLERPR